MLKEIQTRLPSLGADHKPKGTHTLPKMMVLECNQDNELKQRMAMKVELARVALVKEDASSIAKMNGYRFAYDN